MNQPVPAERIAESTDVAEAARVSQPLREIFRGVYALAEPLWKGERKVTAFLWLTATILLAFATTGYAVFLTGLQCVHLHFSRGFESVESCTDCSCFLCKRFALLGEQEDVLELIVH